MPPFRSKPDLVRVHAWVSWEVHRGRLLQGAIGDLPDATKAGRQARDCRGLKERRQLSMDK
jgi:hypothetical protein